MSVEPPSSGRPTGPPSGPLSGGSGQPPSGPPAPPPGGGSSTPQPPGPGRPWWRSVPRVAAVTAAVVAAVIIAVVLTRPGGGSGGGSGSATGDEGEIFLQSAGKAGPDPFTDSSATDSSVPPVTPSATTESAPANTVRGVDGDAPGLYGGTRDTASCDVEKQITFLREDEARNRAFAEVAGVKPTEVPAYLRSLTPVQLRMDTRVTNHGYQDGKATSYQAVLQTGTAILVNDRGLPRVRCACGNPLTDPVPQRTTPKPTGDSWPSYRSSNVVVVEPAPEPVEVFTLYDPDSGDWFGRHRGDTGAEDRPTEPPKDSATPSTTPTTPTAPPSTPTPPSTGTTGPGTPETSGEPVPPETTTQEPPPGSDTPTTSGSTPDSPDNPDTPTSADPGV
ncbi:DUF6777 domain-containing protein [Streptomyces sp. NPDC006997]|uniref:DUF6777 domain-containing protein n=1 Tax=Streptomyces sp. NPDC006997 TaxID=3155356 RepID=UPI0033E3DB58